MLGAAAVMKADKASWVSFFQRLRGRGLEGIKLVVGDKCLGMLETVGEVFPEKDYRTPAMLTSVLPLFYYFTQSRDSVSAYYIPWNSESFPNPAC